MTSTLLHATSIALHGHAALLTGPSGIGKSDLALRCLSLAVGFNWSAPPILISDDQTWARNGPDGVPRAYQPPKLRGQLEIRGVGVVGNGASQINLPADDAAEAARGYPIRLYVALVHNGTSLDRLPDIDASYDLLGHAVPMIHIKPREASAPHKLLAAIMHVSDPGGLFCNRNATPS